MIIGCTNCKEKYSITLYEIQKLDHSVFKCKKCQKFIKITKCPHCESYYSITYGATQKPEYNITCVKCKKSFPAEFPSEIAEEKNKKTLLEPKETTKIKEKLFKNIGFTEKFENTISKAIKPSPNKNLGGIKGLTSFNLQDLLAIGMQSISVSKLTVASIGVAVIFFLLFIYNLVINIFISSTSPGLNPYVNSFLNLIPVSLIFSVYVMISSTIAKMTIDTMKNSAIMQNSVTSFISSSLLSVIVINVALLFGVNLVMILFGEIPIIGPVFFSLLFLPIYLVSLCIVILVSIGFWFFPSIVASGTPGVGNNIKDFISFIKRHNFRLVYILPIMAIITALIYSVFYFIHYGSLSITLLLSNAVLSDEGIKIFASIPSPLLSLSDMAFFGSDASIFRSLLEDLFFTHHIGGIILGIIFSILSILLLAAFISVTGTLSANIYVMMEKGVDTDNKSKIQLLTILVLFLLVLLLFKKVFL